MFYELTTPSNGVIGAILLEAGRAEVRTFGGFGISCRFRLSAVGGRVIVRFARGGRIETAILRGRAADRVSEALNYNPHLGGLERL